MTLTDDQITRAAEAMRAEARAFHFNTDENISGEAKRRAGGEFEDWSAAQNEVAELESYKILLKAALSAI